MIYGANGYTGEMTAVEAVRRGHKPILAGRREDAVRPLAERLGCEHAVFALDDPEAIARHLHGVSALLLCAGPFSTTSAPAVEACLRARTSYLDITGEIPVFEACFARNVEARERGIVILPGVGFDVVPSDCLAAVLAETLPGAMELELAFGGLDTPSGGTLKTTIEGLARGGPGSSAASRSATGRARPSPSPGATWRPRGIRPASPTSSCTWRCRPGGRDRCAWRGSSGRSWGSASCSGGSRVASARAAPTRRRGRASAGSSGGASATSTGGRRRRPSRCRTATTSPS
jgi:hypothetical protein